MGRCIVPNTHKPPLMVETELIMQQLTCNGVLEGIRVCMLGFPNRMLYRDYKARYMVLGAELLATAANDKEGVFALMDKIAFEREKFRCGHTMVFFRAGALAALEEARDGIVLKLIRWMQGEVYGRVKRASFQKKSDQRELMKVIQRNFRKYDTLRNWGWFVIIQKTRPLIGRINLEDELRMLEEAAVAKFGAYEEQLKTKARLGDENELIKEETQALIKQLESEQGNLSQYTDQQERASKAKADYEQKLVAAGQKLIQMEEERVQATADKKVLEGENVVIKKDMEDIELAIQKLDQEKTNMGEVSAKATEDLQSTQDKVDHLSNIKSKLESTLDELEDACNKEKRSRADIEKSRRKIEGELKVTQETVGDLERSKKELEGGIGRKEKDLTTLASKLEDEQSIVAKVQKTIKEIQGRVEELEEELEAERQARAKVEGKRSQLAREYEQLGERLNEAGGATAAQVELNKKREAEVQKLRKGLEEAHIQQEATLMNLKR